jgi:hypothetical protein
VNRRKTLLITASVVLVIVAVAAISLTVGRSISHPDAGSAELIVGADLSGSGPGSLVSASKMPDFERTTYAMSMRSARVVYRSTSGDDGSPTEVSGTVFTPLEQPPPGGWPVVSVGHGTLGWQEDCGPSLSVR